jgi:hypothetical protein
VNLPGGRKATLDFIRQVNAVPKTRAASAARTGAPQNPGLPPPLGTKLALVRQMMLIDDRGEIRPTRLIESLQIRVVHSLREQENDFYEFTLDRKDLFNSKDGLRPTNLRQITFPLFNRTHDVDFFKFPNKVRVLREAAAKRSHEPITENLRFDCIACHTHTGIVTSTAFFHDRSPDLIASDRTSEVERILKWKMDQHQWGLLQGLTEERPKNK